MALSFYTLILILSLIGLPLFAVMLGLSLMAFGQAEIDIQAVAISIYQVAEQPTLMTIPFFTFAGHLMAHAKTANRMLRVAKALLGQVPGGVSLVALLLCAFFTAFTGASGVTIVALGGLLHPLLQGQKLSERFSLGLITTCGSLGLLFAPSLPIILYGVVANVDIEKLFWAGFLPGVLLIALLFSYCIYEQWGQLQTQKFSYKELKIATKEGFWELLIAPLVLVGVYGGYVTAAEASILTAFYILIVECFVYKDISPRQLIDVSKESMILVGAILLILCSALGFTSYLVDEQVPMHILAFIQQYVHSKMAFLVGLNIFLLFVGAIMDIFSAIIVVVPLIIPVANQYGVDPIHLAIIFLTNLEIGYITPPVGINLFIASFQFNRSILFLYSATLRFLVLMIVGLLVITYVPALSLWPFNS